MKWRHNVYFVILLIILISSKHAYSSENAGNKIGRVITNECDNPDNPCAKGYTLFATAIMVQAFDVKLIDMSGTLIKKWVSPDPFKPLVGFPAKMLPNGSLIAFRDCIKLDTNCNEIVQLSWSGELEWSYYADRAHHDFQRKGSPVGYYSPFNDPEIIGYTLYLANELITEYTGIYRKRHLLDPIIREIGYDGKILWEWKAREHFEEWGFSPQAKRLIWLNGKPVYPPMFGISWEKGDYIHINSISPLGENPWYDGYNEFHPENIIISARHTNTVAIISRETGEFVWKLGPGDEPEMIGQHHAHMIPEGLPGEGNILIFDNGSYGGYPTNILPRLNSKVIELNPVTKEIVWMYDSSDYGPGFYSLLVSGAQRLLNGNTLITLGTKELIIEVTSAKEIVWEFNYGLLKPVPIDPDYVVNLMYRAYRIPPEWVPGNPGGYDYWE